MQYQFISTTLYNFIIFIYLTKYSKKLSYHWLPVFHSLNMNPYFLLLKILISFTLTQMSSLFVKLVNRFCLQWLMVVSLAVLYNVIFVLGRAVFWELNNRPQITSMWWTLDYLCDVIYIVDALVHAHEGKTMFIKICIAVCRRKKKFAFKFYINIIHIYYI